MIAYDMLGHATAAVAQIAGRGDLWNKYSPLIWPVLMDDKIKDIYWALWFLTALSLIIVGHFIVGDRSPRTHAPAPTIIWESPPPRPCDSER